MSTISSQLLVTSSALIEDLYKRIRDVEPPQPRLVMYSRFAVLIVAVVAAAMAWSPNDTILALVAFAWAGFGASFGPIVLLCLYWRRLTAIGAVAGMVTGAVVVMIWGGLDGGPGGIFDLYELAPGFAANLLVAWAVSRAGRPDPAVEAEFRAAVTGAR